MILKLGTVFLFVVTLVLVSDPPVSAQSGPTAGSNNLVDFDHGLLFPKNKQNEPSITRDPLNGALIAGANDEFSLDLCRGTTVPLASPCPFTPGRPISAYYRSVDGGKTWTGGYLPGFDTINRLSGGDPSLDVGPRRCADRAFRWSCGSVVYYASLADPFGDKVGGEQITVSRSYDDAATWENPVEATSTDNKSAFDDHEWLAVDSSPASPWFGRVHVFWAVFCYSCAGFGNVKLYVAHSDDEGLTWSRAVQVSAGNNNLARGERETGQVAVASDGTVEAFWTEHADSKGKYPDTQVVVTSKDGGATFSAPITIATLTDYPLTGTPFDAVDLFNRVPGMSARVDCYPHPAADPSSSRMYVVWCDFAGGHGVVKAAVSTSGFDWTQLGTIADVAGRNAFFPAASVSPSGTLSVAFDALTRPPASDPWQTGVQVYDVYYVQLSPTGTSVTAPIRVSSASSNPDASSYNNLMEQFLGDYIDIVSGPTSAYVVWTDTRSASRCAAVDAYRAQVYAGSKTAVAPNPDIVCPSSFGDTDTMVAEVGY
ncbi:MAG: exo-alpha-sialidase [Chloroflexi bacterium]|nr:MAG: exo-alpha-sialidase [Chloroflexota bacterium]